MVNKKEIKTLIQKLLFRAKTAKIEEPYEFSWNVNIRSNVQVGRFTYINQNTTLYSDVRVGRFCSIGKYCEIGAVDHPITWLSTHPFQYNIFYYRFKKEVSKNFAQKKINQIHGCTIGNDVWMGTFSVIKAGITIGDGAIVAASSVVTKDVPPYAIVGGIPAKIIRYRFEPEIVAKLLELKWWNLDIKELNNISFDDIEKAIEELSKLVIKNDENKA